MKIPITIIVPIYKVEIFLKDCLDSIMNQTYKNFQCILVDDCSPDNCGKICDEYAKIDNRFLVVHKEKNEGLSEARNTGLNLIKDTDYVCFIDSDDFVHPQYLEILYSSIIQTNCDIVECNFYPTKENDQINSFIYENYKSISNITLKTGLQRIQDFFDNQSYYMTMNKIYSYDVIKNYKFTKDIWFEDVLFNNEVYLYLNKIGIITYPLYYYRKRKNSITDKRYKEEKGLDILDVWYYTYNLYKNKNINSALLNSIASFLWNCFFFECKDAVKNNYMTNERSQKIFIYLQELEKDKRFPKNNFFTKLYYQYKNLNGDIFKFFNSKKS